MSTPMLSAFSRRTVVVTWIVCLALVTAPAVATSGGAETKAQSTSVDQDVDALWSALTRVPWEMSAQTQGKGAWECQEFHAKSFALRVPEEWCSKCQAIAPPREQGIRFYAFGIDRIPACRLGQFEAWRDRDDYYEVREVHRRLAQRLTNAYGPGQEVNRQDPFELVQLGGWAGWHDIWRWRPSGQEILLYLTVGERDPDLLTRAVIVARAPFLRQQMDEERVLDRLRADWDHSLRGRMNRELATRLRPLSSEVDRWLAKLVSYDVGKVPDGLRQLLERARRSSGELQAALLLAADSRALHHLPINPAEPADPPPPATETLTFGGYRLTYQFLHGAGWVYAHELLWRVYRDHPKTRWGDWAFALLLASGWSPDGCPKDSAEFREVIPRAEAFLRTAAPGNARRSDVLFMLAQAYETWWSVGQAVDDLYVKPDQYKQGAEQARERAVTLYKRILREMLPSSLEALYARRQLPRLQLKRDTGAREFYCIWD